MNRTDKEEFDNYHMQFLKDIPVTISQWMSFMPNVRTKNGVTIIHCKLKVQRELLEAMTKHLLSEDISYHSPSNLNMMGFIKTFYGFNFKKNPKVVFVEFIFKAKPSMVIFFERHRDEITSAVSEQLGKRPSDLTKRQRTLYSMILFYKEPEQYKVKSLKYRVGKYAGWLHIQPQVLWEFITEDNFNKLCDINPFHHFKHYPTNRLIEIYNKLNRKDMELLHYEEQRKTIS